MSSNYKVLVTGGTGFIGSHTVVELQNAGYEVVIIDNLSNSFEFIVDNIEKISGKRPEFYKINLCDKAALGDFFLKNTDINGIIHFAAFKSVSESHIKPNLYYYNNIVTLLNLLEFVHLYSIKHIVFSSSCTVYGNITKFPVNETSPLLKPISPYGNTKRIAENILEDNSIISDLKVVTLRYFNPAGAHESSLLGELPLNKPENLMPVLTQYAIGKGHPVTIYGSDYPTPDGTAIRDFFHVSDLARAHVLALKYLREHPNKQNYNIFNLGSEKGYSVLEVVQTFERLTGIKLNYQFGPRRKGDIPAIYADSTLARNELHWSTEKSLEDIILDAWNWEKYLKSIDFKAN